MALKFSVIYSFQRDTTPRLATADDSVGGVKVSIVAFQAIDPGSIPGWRSFLVNSFRTVEGTFVDYLKSLLSFQASATKRKACVSKEVEKTPSDFIAQAVNYQLFTSAVHLLHCMGTFACCVSALGQYVPHYLIWYTGNSFSVTMLKQCLDWTLVLHSDSPYMDLNSNRSKV